MKNHIRDIFVFCFLGSFFLICQCFSTGSARKDNVLGSFSKSTKKEKSDDCCDDTFIITSDSQPEGYLKAPPLYDEINEFKSSKKSVECIYKFYGKPNERIQLFYEDFDLYYPYDIKKFNKIDCRYADSICLKFSKTNTSNANQNVPSLNMENSNYDICNCINLTYASRQIMSSSNFLQVRFRSIPRSVDASSIKFRGYLIRYKFTNSYGIDNSDGGVIEPNGSCKIFFYAKDKKDGYFSSPNYPGLYPRDIECHYYFFGERDQNVQITFHTFDVEGVDQCKAETKSDYVELSNFQNRDRYFSRFCGLNKPSAIISDNSFFHVTFFSNNLFDGKGFQASYHFINIYTSQDPVRKNPAGKQQVDTNIAAESSNEQIVMNSSEKQIQIFDQHSVVSFLCLVVFWTLTN